MSKSKDMIAIAGTKEQVGLYKTDIDDLDAKVGDWIKVEYINDGVTKKINSKVREKDRETAWNDNLIFLSTTQLKKLEIVELVGDSEPHNPRDVKVKVTEYDFYWSPTLKTAVLTVILTFLGAIFTALAQMDWLYKIPFGIAAIIVTMTGPLIALVIVLLQKQ